MPPNAELVSNLPYHFIKKQQKKQASAQKKYILTAILSTNNNFSIPHLVYRLDNLVILHKYVIITLYLLSKSYQHDVCRCFYGSIDILMRVKLKPSSGRYTSHKQFRLLHRTAKSQPIPIPAHCPGWERMYPTPALYGLL